MNQQPLTLDALLGGGSLAPEHLATACAWLNEYLRDDPKACRDLIEALMPLARASGDAAGTAWLQFYLGWLAIDADDFEQGAAIMESARSTFEDLGHGEGLARCLNALGFSRLSLGVYDLALDLFRESMNEAEKVGRLDMAAAAAMNMADCLYELEEPEEALQIIEHCRKELTIAPHNISSAHRSAGLIYRALGRLAEAERELTEAIRTVGGALHNELEARQVLAEVHIDGGRPEEAWALVEPGLEACARSGERVIGSRFRLTRARLLTADHRASEAISDIEAAIQSARDIGAHKVEMDAEKALYLAWQTCGECQKALAAFVRHTSLKDAMKKEQTSRRILGLHDERARREARHFETLYRQVSAISEIGQRITANLDLEVTLEHLYGAINGIMDAPTVLIALVDEENQSLEYRLVMVRGERKEPFSYPLSEETFGCWCVNHRSVVHIGDLESEYRQYVKAYDDLVFDGAAEKSLVFIPLLSGEKVAGVLSVQSHIRHAYDKQRVETIRAIGAYVAIAIQNARLFRQIQRIATIDGLTGLLNRRCLTETIEDEYLKTRRYKRSAGIIMADVDHFKRVNDTYGHDIGDAVLRAIAKVLAGKVRDCDFVGRFGGEEFVVLLPETALEGARILAERLREAIEATEIPLPEGGVLSVTASFGVAVIRPGDPGHDAVVKRADQALYRSKQTGRNRVTLESTE